MGAYCAPRAVRDLFMPLMALAAERLWISEAILTSASDEWVRIRLGDLIRSITQQGAGSVNPIAHFFDGLCAMSTVHAPIMPQGPCAQPIEKVSDWIHASGT